jgi:predicted transcriptional regulator
MDMPKEALFTVELDAKLREQFVAEAEALDRPAAEVMKDLMRDFVQRRREERQYDVYLADKVAKARKSIAAGLVHPNAEVEQEFSAWREAVLAPDER